MKEVKIELTSPTARMPERNNPTDAGADLFSPVDIILPAKSRGFISFGFKMELPKGTAGFIYARSGLGTRDGIIPRNCVGVIDEAYRGEVGIMVENTGEQRFAIHIGDRIAQLVISKVETPTFKLASTLTETDRGENGFGSSGK